MDDATAVRACWAGDVNAFRYLVDRYQGRALAHAGILTRNEADAADATQEAFVDAFRNLTAFDPGRAFYGWFYVLLRNRCFKQRSRRGTRPESGLLAESIRQADPKPSLPSRLWPIGVLIVGWRALQLSIDLPIPMLQVVRAARGRGRDRDPVEGRRWSSDD